MKTNTQTIRPKTLAILAFLLAALLATLLLAACVAPVGMPAAAPTAIPVPERVAFDVAPDGQPVAVTLPVTQPLPSLVMLNAGTITVTETITGEAEPPAVVIPVQGAFTIPVWRANGHHRHPLAVILPDAYRVCEANVAEEWPCPPGLQRNDYLGLRGLAQSLALSGYFPVIVDLNGAYSPAAGPVAPADRAVQMVDHLLAWMADDMREPWAESYGGEMSQATDYARIVVVGHGRGAAMALAVAQARVDRTSDEEIAAGLGPVAGLLLVAPDLPADAALVDVPTAVVLPGCSPKSEEALVEAAQASPERQSLLARVLLPGATRDGFNPLAAAGEGGCDGGTALAPAEQQAWLGAYAPAFADVATGYAPASAAAGLDALVAPPSSLYGLPVAVVVTDPSRPGRPGEIQIFNLGDIVVEQPGIPVPADRLPLRVEGTFVVPEGPGPHPVVVLLHLRGTSCFDNETFVAVWPCQPAAIPHYEWGYDYLLEALAGRGYAVAAPNLIGALSEAPAWSDPEDPQGARSLDYFRVEPLVDRLLAELAAANRGESMAFGLDLTGRLDLGQLAIVGHSRGGEWANMLAQRRQGNTSTEDIAAGRGSIGAVLLLTPSYGDFAEQEPESLTAADVPIAVVPAYCDDDLRENPLSGQAYLEGALQDGGRSSPAWVVALQTGEHYGFNPVIPFPSYNPNSVFCQDREQLLAPEDAQTFLAQLAPDFLDVAFGRRPASAIPGFEPSQPLTTALYGAPVEITALPGPEQRLPLLIPMDDAELATNLVGGAVEAEGTVQVSTCEGTGERMCVVDTSVTLRPEATVEDWVYAQPKFAGYPPQLRVQWGEPGARLRLTIPEGAGDLSGYAMLHFRTLVDMFDQRNDGVDAQSFSVALVDRPGNRAVVVLSPEEPALIKDRGERIDPYYWSYYPLRARSVRIPLADFGGVDLGQVAAVELVFDQAPRGSILVSDVEVVAAAAG